MAAESVLFTNLPYGIFTQSSILQSRLFFKHYNHRINIIYSIVLFDLKNVGHREATCIHGQGEPRGSLARQQKRKKQ